MPTESATFAGMRVTIMTLALAVSTTACAQLRTDTASVEVRMSLAGEQLEKAGEIRSGIFLHAGLLGVMGLMETQSSREDWRTLGWTLVGISAASLVTVQFVIGDKERRAGRILQGKPPNDF